MSIFFPWCDYLPVELLSCIEVLSTSNMCVTYVNCYCQPHPELFHSVALFETATDGSTVIHVHVVQDSTTRPRESIWTTIIWASVCLDHGGHCCSSHEHNILFLVCACLRP